MSWARLAAELDATTKWMQRAASSPSNAGDGQLVGQCHDSAAAFYALVDAGQQEGGAPPAGRDAALLSGSIARAAKRLQALRGLELGLRPADGSGAESFFVIRAMLLQRCCDLLGACAKLASACELPAAEACQFAQAAAQLVLDAGTRALQTAERNPSCVLNAGSGSPHAVWLPILEDQARALEEIFSLANSYGADGLNSFASAGMPPTEFAAWLSTATATLLLLRGVRGSAAPTTTTASTLCFISLLGAVFWQPEAFASHFLALQRDQQLQGRLLDLLLPALSAAAVALQLPSDRRGGHSWVRAADLARVLCSSALWPAVVIRLAASEADSRAALRSAAILALHAPGADLDQQEALGLCSRLADVLFLAANRLRPEGWGQRVAEQLRGALPGLRSALQLAAAPAAAETAPAAAAAPAAAPEAAEAEATQAAQPAEGQAAISAASRAYITHLCSRWDALLELLARWCKPGSDNATSTVGGVAGLEAWLGVAVSALQALPPLASLSQQSSSKEMEQWSSTAVRLCGLAAAVAASMCTNLPAAVLAEGGSEPPSARRGRWASGGLESAMAAIWLLHTAVCRAAHWAAGGRSARVLLQPAANAGCAELLVEALGSLLLVYWVLMDDSSAVAGSPLRSMAAAHVAALAALASSGCELEPAWCGLAAISLAGAARGLDSLPLQPAFSGAFGWALGGMLASPADSAEKKILACLSLLQNASETAQLAAVLAADDTLERLARELIAGTVRTQAAVSEEQAAEAAQNLAGCILKLQHAPGSQQAAELGAVVAAAMQAHVVQPGLTGAAALATIAQHVLPPARELAAALLEWWRRPEQAAADALELAQAAALRSCAYLRCANLAGEGGPAAGQGAGSLKCSACRAVWYCGTACSHADWREPGGHRRVCRALGEARQAARRRQQAAGEAAAE